jgi:hypothetical protein
MAGMARFHGLFVMSVMIAASFMRSNPLFAQLRTLLSALVANQR